MYIECVRPEAQWYWQMTQVNRGRCLRQINEMTGLLKMSFLIVINVKKSSTQASAQSQFLYVSISHGSEHMKM